MRRLLSSLAFALALTSAAHANDLLEPALSFAPGIGAPRVAVTLDACMGGVDHRILDVLVREHIPATLFVTARWMSGNAETAAILAAHPDLFEIEDHGRNHVPAVIGSEKPYGITPAGTLAAVDDEVLGGGEAILAGFGRQPTWFRGATALYTPDAMDEINKLGYRVAGFSLNADFGASATAKVAQSRIEGAQDGDVIIAHINQPSRPAGEGIAAGLLTLKQNGYIFLRLDQMP
ncbi:MAG: polysaccharide deacetylase family protein [Devosia sp.]|nr:polysaccharide deacetylase family protein [Devosia sp.]